MGGKEVLSEYRDDSPIPLRAAKDVVEAVAEILSGAGKPLPFSSIQAAVAKKLHVEPGEYQARIALRFLQSIEVGLVARQKARYKAIDADKIRRSLAAALSELPRR